MKIRATIDLYSGTSGGASKLGFATFVTIMERWTCVMPRWEFVFPATWINEVIVPRWTHNVARWCCYRNIFYKIQIRIQNRDSIFRRLQSIRGSQGPRNTPWISHQLIVGYDLCMFHYLLILIALVMSN